MDIILKYFPEITSKQIEQFKALETLYADWNAKINIISRKDIDYLYEKHVLHSISIAKFISFSNGTKVLDFGTGGGLPGIPLAILFPEAKFTLCDSVAKKILVAESISQSLGLINIDFVVGRVEDLNEKFHFITSRAVSSLEKIYRWTQDYLEPNSFNSKINGYLLLKGGILNEEISDLKKINRKLLFDEIGLDKWFNEEYFNTKKLIYIH